MRSPSRRPCSWATLPASTLLTSTPFWSLILNLSASSGVRSCTLSPSLTSGCGGGGGGGRAAPGFFVRFAQATGQEERCPLQLDFPSALGAPGPAGTPRGQAGVVSHARPPFLD